MSEQQSFSGNSSLTRLKEVYSVAKAENSNASMAERATLAGALVGLAFDWSTGNESMLGFVASTTHELTHNPVLAGVASGVASFVEQGVIGGLVALTIDKYPNAMKNIRETVNYNRDLSEDTPAKRLARVMFLGSGVEVVVENSRRDHTRSDNIRRAIANAAIIASANATLIGAASGVMLIGEKHGLETVTDPIINVLSNPLTYVAAIMGVVGFNKSKRIWRRLVNRTQVTPCDRAVKSTGE